MREVEVLQDQLLDMFAEDPDLDPGQVVVLTPDIDAYGPFIEAVFGSESGPRHIPFSIADRSARRDNATADAFLSLLEVLGSRFEADRVMALLDSPALRGCFGLSEEDREQLVDWVRDLGVRWGIDAEMRAAHGMPSTREHSWRFGLERLLLGFALPEGPRPEIFQNILPDGRLDVGGAQVLGRFLRFFERLVTLQRVVSAGHPIAEWARHLQSALDRFFDGDGEHAPELQQIRDAISDLAACADEAGYGGIVPSEVVVRELESRLDRGRGAGRFLTGGVTFCAMVPMRSVPFAVVCLIGLNDAVYPRLDKRVDFDRLGHTWRRGDRSGREDDRYLFLEAILSARRRLYVSYVGASVRDNSAIPPSVLVAELLDTLDRRFGGRPGEVREAIQVRHPLQAFNPRYFIGDEPLFSYSAELCAAARARYEASGHPGWLVTEPLPARATSDSDVTLDELTRFLLNPTRHFLEARLGIRLTARDGALAQREPFVPTRSEWRQVQALIRGLDEADRDQSGSALARAAGLLPHGPAGELVYSESLRAVREFESRHLLLREAVLLPPEDFRLSIGDFVLSGRLESVGRQGLLRHSLKPCGAWDWLSLWVAHLCLNAAPPEGVLTESRLFCPDGCLTLNPVSEPLPVLGDLLALRARGDCEPIPFFPRAAKIYVDRCRSTRAAMPPLAKAESNWFGGDFARGESIDPHVDLLYRGISPIDQRFADVAMCVWTPLLECAEWQ
jgi:exodeoxyribonuclease V gamma subunit